MRASLAMLVVLGIAFLAGCQSQQGETMVLLEEKIAAVNISKSNGFDDMNVDIFQSFIDDESIRTFKKAITTAQKQMGKVDMSEPEYDVMVEYENELPTHGIHLWLGKENEKSMFMYIGDDEVYLTSPKITGKLRALIISGE